MKSNNFSFYIPVIYMFVYILPFMHQYVYIKHKFTSICFIVLYKHQLYTYLCW
jgi:hypothetical protein